MPGSCRAKRTRRGRGLGLAASRLAAALCAAAAGLSPSYAQAPAPPDAPGTAQSAPDLLFRFPAEGVVSTGPVIAGELAWFISDSKTLFIMDVSGRAIGRRALDIRSAAFIACDPYGRAALPDGQRGLMLVNKAGQLVWRYELPSPAFAPPAYGPDGRLYVAAGEQLLCLAPNGALIWRRALGGKPIAGPVAGPGGGPALSLHGGRVLALGQDGEVLIDRTLGVDAAYLAGRLGELGCALQGGGFIVLRAGAASDPGGAGSAGVGAGAGAGASGPDGPASSRSAEPRALAAGPDGYALLDADGRLRSFGPDGEELWELRTGIRPPLTLRCYAGRVVLLSSDLVRSYGADGALFRELSLRNAAGPPAITGSGAVLSGGRDWIVYAYRFERPLVGLAPERPRMLDRGALKAAAAEALRWYASEPDDDAVMGMLVDIEKSLESGTIGEGLVSGNMVAAAVAMGALSAPFGSGAVRAGPVPRDGLSRIKAIELLGDFGFPASTELLAELFRAEREPAVKAAAAGAVARIGLDPGGVAMEAFAAEATTGRLDARGAEAVVAAIESLYRASGGLDKPAGALALLRVAGNASYPEELRRRAQRVLRTIARP